MPRKKKVEPEVGPFGVQVTFDYDVTIEVLEEGGEWPDSALNAFLNLLEPLVLLRRKEAEAKRLAENPSATGTSPAEERSV